MKEHKSNKPTESRLYGEKPQMKKQPPKKSKKDYNYEIFIPHQQTA